MPSNQPIAIFDSGVGGLTVLDQILHRLPAEEFVYFGDTARVPYGSKSSRTIIRFAVEDCRFLMRFDPKMIVVACNTASSFALDTLSAEFDIPVIGVVEPGAVAAVAATRTRRVGVIATQTTVNSGSYPRTIARLDAKVEVFQKAAPLLVPMVEEGRPPDDPVVPLILESYLADLKQAGVDVLVLGCTHYPLLREAIAKVMGPTVTLVDSAHQTAAVVHQTLTKSDLCRGDSQPAGKQHFWCSDNPELFAKIGRRFLSTPIDEVHHADPEIFFEVERL
jgi:glutamate racemase